MILNRYTILSFFALSAHNHALTNNLRVFSEDEVASDSLSSSSDTKNYLELPLEHVHLRAKFSEWKEKFGKVYFSVEEEFERLLVWIKNHEFIEQHNKKNLSYKLGHNHFSDLTNDEFKRRNFLGEYSPSRQSIKNKQKKTAEEFKDLFVRSGSNVQPRVLMESDSYDPYLDWRQKGAVTPVKDQGMCGSCWSFSTTGAIEGAMYLTRGELVPLSEQNLIDCDYVDLGCSGGLMDDAFQYDENAGGLCSEEDYPYLAEQEEICRTNCTPVVGSHVVDFTDVEPNNVEMLMAAISQQPVAVAVEADTPEFQLYSSGVLDSEACGVDLDHAVLAVGYGTEGFYNKTDYFLVKNSWGEDWGDYGYIKIARDSVAPEGMCGILGMCSYPTTE